MSKSFWVVDIEETLVVVAESQEEAVDIANGSRSDWDPKVTASDYGAGRHLPWTDDSYPLGDVDGTIGEIRAKIAPRRRRMICPSSGKEGHESRGDAMRAAGGNRQRQSNTEAYKCSACGWYHVSTQRTKTRRWGAATPKRSTAR